MATQVKNKAQRGKARQDEEQPATSTEEREQQGGRIKQLTLRLPEEYHRKLKILAACSGKSMTEILITCIDERLQTCLKRELKNVE